ncbi:hypothetical protein SAMN05192575_101800 [Nocardioides alpinus]|uniref:PPE family protein n=1 Tax=Nocardioides alpinus TaxID=748909 RepID=A0A1I0W8L4_9ACTN|nr:hypothetical protein [Nocardioides alpinus]SFA84951.1 hypothetical protein SAMN05192575_101800 [Nocardioides alpinus]
MPANPWELRADVRPLDLAAQRWTEIGALLARRGDELVAVARRATEGWDAAAAESYEEHRRQVLAHLDRFTDLTAVIAGSLRAVSGVLTSAQKELDQAWTNVAMVPHDVVGESRHLVFRPAEDDDRGKVTRGQAEADEIRRRLTLALDQEGTRLRSARSEFVMVRSELTTLTGGAFPGGLPDGAETGVGAIAPASTSVRGSAQSGVTALPPIAPLSVSMPDLSGLSGPSPAGLAPLAATAASGMGRRDAARAATTGMPPVGGMGGAAMGVRGGTTSRGMDSGRAGARRLATPTLKGATEDEAARLARDREAARASEKEAKRAALAERRAERAARRAEREAEKDDRDPAYDVELEEDEREDEREDELGDEVDEGLGPDAETDDGDHAQRR